ncbi:MAG TPA: hypothetical protein VK879_19125 [Candidatus Sulfomarinibacteraceae bacterium]|nr:hypothetical protein [Candidatus Sulfomarinibacteraceae bacterium]
MPHSLRRPVLVLCLLWLSSLACAIPSFNGEPTPPPEPTPEGDTILFNAPYNVRLQPGATIPGTNVRYVQSVGDVHELSIDGLQAYRQVGDSVTWRGIVAPGVYGDYRLRLRSDFGGNLRAEGEVSLAVLNPAPVEIPPTQTPDASIYFAGMPISYFVPEGYRVPGTTLIFQGVQNDLAELSGTASYPFFARDDSLLWLGKLRDNVYVRYNLRVSSLNQSGLGLSGTAELWVTP